MRAGMPHRTRPPGAAGSAIALAAALAGAASGCGPDPDPPAVAWATACGDLDAFVLSGWARTPNDVWFVGGNASAGEALLLHYDGERWLRITGVSDHVLWWVTGVGNEIWAVGEDATALHFKGGLWTKTCTLPTGCAESLFVCSNDASVGCTTDDDCPFVILPTLYGAWGSAPDAVWAVGGSNNPTGPKDVFRFWDGEQWIPGSVDVPSGQTIFKVWGNGADDVWAVGGGGAIFHYTGGIWHATPSPTGEDLFSVWGTAADDVWAIGGISSGTLLHYDGTAWSTVQEGFSTGGMISVWCSPGTSPIVTGYYGYAARLRGGVPELLPTGVDQALHATFGDGSGTWAVGGNLSDPSAGPGGVILRFGLETAPCVIEEYEQPLVPSVDCGTNSCPGGGGSVGPGLACNSGNDCECEDGLECWYFVISDMQTLNHFVCSEQCANDAQCQAVYGAGACCRIPGPQEVRSFCHSPGYTPIEGDPCM
jgi:hypothetical protein